MFIELNMMITFFIFRRPIIIGWGRDTGMIFWPIWNSIRICGWRLDRQVDPIKIMFMGSPTLQPTTCGRPVVFQPLGAPNLRSSWPCSNTRLSSLTNTTTYQQSTHNSKHLKHNKERSLNKSKRLKYNKKQSLNNKKRLMNSFTKWSWTWQHIVEHMHLILCGHITTSFL
jgi:hypothetical protein